MAAPTTDPVRFIPPGYADATELQEVTSGPWEYNGALYCLFENLAFIDVPPMTDGFNMYKSTDRGETWAVQDAQDSSFFAGGELIRGTHSQVRMLNVIYMAFRRKFGSTVTYYIASFDFTTDTWTAPGGAGPSHTEAASGDVTEGREFSHAVARDGVVYLLHPDGHNGSNWQILAYTSWTPGGGWGSTTTIKSDAARHHSPLRAILAGSEIHFFSESDTDRGAGSSTETHLHHVTLDNVDALGTYQTLATDLTRTRNLGQVSYGADGRLCVPYYDWAGASTTVLHVLFADNVVNPTWSDSPIAFPDDPDDDWFWGQIETHAYVPYFSGCIYAENAWRVFSTTSWDPGVNLSEKSRLWMHTWDGSAWTDTLVWEIFEDPNPDDGDNKSFYLLGSPQAQPVTEGVGLLFYAEDSDVPTERGGSTDQREYYFVLESDDLGGGGGNGGGECVAITPPGITPDIEWKDEALEDGLVLDSGSAECVAVVPHPDDATMEWDNEPTELVGT